LIINFYFTWSWPIRRRRQRVHRLELRRLVKVPHRLDRRSGRKAAASLAIRNSLETRPSTSVDFIASVFGESGQPIFSVFGRRTFATSRNRLSGHGRFPRKRSHSVPDSRNVVDLSPSRNRSSDCPTEFSNRTRSRSRRTSRRNVRRSRYYGRSVRIRSGCRIDDWPGISFRTSLSVRTCAAAGIMSSVSPNASAFSVELSS